MTTTSIPVDPFNPGQVFGCLGLMEVSEELFGGTRAGFDWSDPNDTRFVLRTEGDEDPVVAALRFIVSAQITALAPHDSDLNTEGWGVATTKSAAGSPFPAPRPASAASMPAELVVGDKSVTIASWAEVNAPGVLSTRRDNVKFWGGSKGKPGAQFIAEALTLVRPTVDTALADPFNFAAPQGGSLRFDWRRDYIPLEIGFSLNQHKAGMRSLGYPLVEVLAAIGLAHARPRREKKLLYRYGIAGRADVGQPETTSLLPPTFLRAVLGAAQLPFSTRTFVMQLGWPGKANQARCITTVSEEIAP